MPIINFLEGVVAGDRNIPQNMRQLGYQGRDAYNSGLDLSNEGVSGIRKLGDSYEQMLKSGKSVLPDSTNSVLKRARGAIADRNVRDTMASAARLRQARVGSGGKLSAEAAQEYLTQAEADSNRAAQEAGLGLDTQQAGMELTETNTLRDRLSQAREQVLGAGERRMQLGQAGQIASLQLRHARQAAIASTISSFF